VSGCSETLPIWQALSTAFINVATAMDLAKQAGMQLTAGGSAGECASSGYTGRRVTVGLVEVCLMHPLDLVKTRMQIQRAHVNVSVYRTLRSIVQREGISGLYKVRLTVGAP